MNFCVDSQNSLFFFFKRNYTSVYIHGEEKTFRTAARVNGTKQTKNNNNKIHPQKNITKNTEQDFQNNVVKPQLGLPRLRLASTIDATAETACLMNSSGSGGWAVAGLGAGGVEISAAFQL